MIDESKKQSSESQNIDGVLEELKRSYSSDNAEENDIINDESSSFDFSHDELQEKLRSQFMNDSVSNTEDSVEDDYVIDEDFLADAYKEDEPDVSDESDTVDDGFDDLIEEDYEEFSDEIKENEYEFYEGFGESDPQIEAQEAFEEEIQASEEASDFEGVEALQKEEAEEDDKEDQEISVYEGLEEIQEDADYQTLEEIYASEEVQEIQEEIDENIQITDDYFDDGLFEADEYFASADEEMSASSIAIAVKAEEQEFVDIEEESAQKKAEDNYIDVFYRSNDEGPFGNRSFKEIIAETTMSVDSLEAVLNAEEDELDYEPERFDEAEGIPLVMEEERDSVSGGIDTADLELLHQFGYIDDLLITVSSESIEKLSEEEFENDVDEQIASEPIEIPKEVKAEKPLETKPKETGETRKIKTKEKINNRYLEYRRMRGSSLLKLLLSSLFALTLILYELLPIFGAKFPSFMDRGRSMPLYVFFGAFIMLAMLIPAIKQIVESFKKFLIVGIDAYVIVGVTVCLTVLYDFIIIFAVPEYTVAPTFHLCVAVVLVLAEVSELLRDITQVRNYEYYFSEFIFEDEYEDDVSNYKYTLQKSEGKGSVAEKMYAGGVSPKRVICAPQNVDSTNGFFDANKRLSKKNRFTFPLVIGSAISAVVFTIISAIVSGTFWIAMVTFMATFSFTLPVVAIIAEWLPFERLSAANYAYGSAFASEASIEKASECDMLVFYDSHLFEKCDSKSVNLAIYDSTSKAVLLSCLNSVYSEIGGPLQSALASVKTQSFGECKINRVARSGIEATVGSSFSVLVGDEQFMSRYGIEFPSASLGREEDKIFTLCVSVNNRATARIAVKYKINDVFFDLIQNLAEDNVSCVIETYDPMISTALVSRLRSQSGFQINIVHKSATDLALEKHRGTKDGALFSALGKDLNVLARGSRLNLAVAVSNARKMRFLRFMLNIVAGASALIGLGISILLVLLDKMKSPSLELFIALYWLFAGAVFAGIMIWKFPRRNRFVFKKQK